jgi:hypothetical protein
MSAWARFIFSSGVSSSARSTVAMLGRARAASRLRSGDAAGCARLCAPVKSPALGELPKASASATSALQLHRSAARQRSAYHEAPCVAAQEPRVSAIPIVNKPQPPSAPARLGFSRGCRPRWLGSAMVSSHTSSGTPRGPSSRATPKAPHGVGMTRYNLGGTASQSRFGGQELVCSLHPVHHAERATAVAR